jgi:hypothetical protein
MGWLFVLLACWCLLGLWFMRTGRGRDGLVELYQRMGYTPEKISARMRILFVEYLVACVTMCGLAIYFSG